MPDSRYSHHAVKQTALGVRFECPCCHNFTLLNGRVGDYEVCSVCLWEDDVLQLKDATLREGANAPSLREARMNYHRFGAAEQSRALDARPPAPEELP